MSSLAPVLSAVDAATGRSQFQPHGRPVVQAQRGRRAGAGRQPAAGDHRPRDRQPRSPVSTDRELQVWVGGPVEPNRSWVLVGEEPDEEEDLRGMRIADKLYLSTSPDLLRRLLEPSPPMLARLFVGYSGWGPGQLDAELEASAWLMSDVDHDLIFNTPPDKVWEAAIRRLGADPATLTMSRGVH